MLERGPMRTLPAAEALETVHPLDVVAGPRGVRRRAWSSPTSFADAVLLPPRRRAIPGAEVVLLDTQYLFAET